MIADQVWADSLAEVEATLGSDHDLWSPGEPVASSVALLEGLSQWVLKRQPDVVVIGVGRADTRRVCYGEAERLVPIEQFERNLRCALRCIAERSTALPVCATISPVDRRHVGLNGEGDKDFGYDNETIALYNEELKAVASKLGASVIDLYGIVKAASRDESVRPDGIRFNERGRSFIAKALAKRLSGICHKLGG